MKILCSGTQYGGFQFLLILDLRGISFHAVVVFGLGKNLLFKYILFRTRWGLILRFVIFKENSDAYVTDSAVMIIMYSFVVVHEATYLQLNLHETDLLFRYLSHHLTWHCLLISGFFPVLVCCDHKIVLHWYENQNKNNLVIMLRKSWEILGNLQKSTNNFMSNSG